MTRIAKKILLVFCSFVFVLCFGIVGMLGLNTDKTIEAKAETAAPTVNFVGVSDAVNNSVGVGGFDGVYLKFDGDLPIGQYVNNGSSVNGAGDSALAGIYTTVAGSPTIKAAAPTYFVWVDATYADQKTLILLNGYTIYPTGTMLHIEEGTTLGNTVLPAVHLVVNEEGKFVECEPTVTFAGVNENQNNETWDGDTWTAHYLTFEGPAFANHTNISDLTAATEYPGIYYTEGGVKTNFPFVYFDADGNYANATENTIILLTRAQISDGSTLTIEEGTYFGGQYLPAVELLMVDKNWTKLERAEFSSIGAHNNSSENTPWPMLNLIDLVFNKEFKPLTATVGATYPTITYTVPGGTAQTFAYVTANNTEVGGANANTLSLLLDAGISLPMGTELTIKSGTQVSNLILPALTLYVDADGKWTTEKPTMFTGFGTNNNSQNSGWTTSFDIVDLVFNKEFKPLAATVGADYSKIYYTVPGGTAQTFAYVTANNGTWIHGGTANTLSLLRTAGTSLPTGTVLTIEDGTEVAGVGLPAVTLYMGGDGKWTTTKPVMLESVSTDDGSVSLTFNTVLSAADTTATLSGLTATDGVTVTGASVEAGSYVLTLTYNALPSFSESLTQIKLALTSQTAYGDVKIEPFTLYYNDMTGAWQIEEYTYDPTAEEAEFVKIAFSNSIIVNVELSKNVASDDTQLNLHTDVNCELVTAMTLDGGKVSLNGIFVNSPYGGSAAKNHLEIILSAEPAHAAHLHIPAGTHIKSKLVVASNIDLYYNKTTQTWQAEKPAPIVSGFTAVEGGSIRIDSQKGGLRFETHLEKETYESLVKTYGKKNIRIGTYILPAEYLTLSGKSLREYVMAYMDRGDTYILNVSTWNDEKGDFGFANSDKDGNIIDGGSFYKYYGTIANVQVKNYLVDFIGVGYIWVTDKEGETYLYLTHDGSWSRNVYEIAKEAYKDTANVSDDKTWGITPYFDKVIEISTDGSAENKLVYDIDSVLEARPSCSYTKPTNYTVTVADGVITIASTSDKVYNVMLNGVRAGYMAAGATAYADYYAVTPELVDTAAEAGALNFGIGEPTQELWGTDAVDGFNKTFATTALNGNSTATNIAKVNKEYNGNTARVWFQIVDVCWPIGASSFAFEAGAIDAIQGVVDDFRAEGVTNIALMSGVANYRSTKNFYSESDKKWYTFWDAEGKGAKAYPNLIVLPNEDDYDEFIALQKEYFKQIALNVRGLTTIEILNELETSILNQTRFGVENGYAPDIALVAQAAMDICKAATDGVREAGKNIKIMMPALCCVSEKKDGKNVTRYGSTDLLNAEYNYIMGENGTKNADDYFQIINLHPYVVLSSDTSNTNYLYYEANDKLTLQKPTTIKENWVDYMNGLRTIFKDNGDAEKPVWITEFGVADYNGACDDPIDATKWNDYTTDRVLRQAQVFQVIYDAIKDMPWIDSVLFFRLGDYEHTGDHNYADCGEATYGMIDKNGDLKAIGKYLYAMLNGAEIFTDSGYTALKGLEEITMPEGVKSISDFTTAVNGIY